MNLSPFDTATLFEAATNLFSQLGIMLNSNTKEALPVRDLLKQHFKETEVFKTISKTFFIGIIDDSVFRATGMFDEKYSYKQALQQADKSYEGLMLFALELFKQPTRTEMSELTRAFNRISQKMPVALVLKYKLKAENESALSIAISERFKFKQNWRQGEKAGKVIILRDIHTQTTHTGHLRILQDLVKPVDVTNYAQLHEHWLQVLDVSILNKKFFQELANWYFWAMNNVQFPDDIEKKKDIRNATNLIRLITRIIFIWFIKEKKLVPANLFREDFLETIVKDFAKNKKASNYYHAILQNLFFGTLNQKMTERGFVTEGNFQQNKTEYGVKTLFRYADKFAIGEKEALQLFKDVPFLNGGLFDCLDKPNEAGTILYVDGFSRNTKQQATVPDYLFFGEEQEVDLNEIFGTKNKRHKVKGLVNLLESYKFTVAENTPIEEEIALDPELLGKVFENLLASYNPETQTTARKQTGSFYTPREIVNYMVDESLLEYLKQQCDGFPDLENRLRDLFSYSDNPNPFNEKETRLLIKAINKCKILDPACGSGAYPMGVLHKLVHILTKLDPDNSKWKIEQEERIIGEKIKELEKDKKSIDGLSDNEVKQKARVAVDDRLKEIRDIFESENNFDDYSRKLFLIENCIYGIDIQPIAVQITKLRFFISLIIDQNKQEGKDNLGIRSLPNLETKFVAANSLIELTKPTGFDFRNQTVIELEEKLKANRHKYFAVKTRQDKLATQREDKLLRKTIAAEINNEFARHEKSIRKQIEILNQTLQLQKQAKVREVEKSKYEKAKAETQKKISRLEDALVDKTLVEDTARKIASFDIYDQNLSADWFEPEWMFGKDVENGFDIVIGNPPYGADIQQLFKEYKRLYDEVIVSYGEIYKMFYKCGIGKLKENGTLAYITSNTFISQPRYHDLRKYLLQYDILKLVNLGLNVFSENVVVPVCISLISKNDIKSNFPFADLSTDSKFTGRFDEIDFEKLTVSEIKSSKDFSFYNRTEFGSVKVEQTFDDVLEIKDAGIQYHRSGIGLKNKGGNDLYERLFSSSKKDFGQSKPTWYGKLISAYAMSETSDEYFNLNYKDVLKSDETASFSSEAFAIKKKILWRQTASSLVATIDSKGRWFRNTIQCCWVKNEYAEKVKLEYCLALCNSRAMAYFYNEIVKEAGRVFPQVKIKHVKKLPFVMASGKAQNQVSILVEYLLFLNGTDITFTSFFKKVLDAIVYELYLAESIKKEDCEILKWIVNLPKLNADWDDEIKLKTIEKVYTELSRDDHSVKLAMNKIQSIDEVKTIEGNKEETHTQP